jgi:hypothetical protein
VGWLTVSENGVWVAMRGVLTTRSVGTAVTRFSTLALLVRLHAVRIMNIKTSKSLALKRVNIISHFLFENGWGNEHHLYVVVSVSVQALRLAITQALDPDVALPRTKANWPKPSIDAGLTLAAAISPGKSNANNNKKRILNDRIRVHLHNMILGWKRFIERQHCDRIGIFNPPWQLGRSAYPATFLP